MFYIVSDIHGHIRLSWLKEELNKYCKWCYVDGKYTYTNMEDLINVCVKHMVPRFTESEARSYMEKILPNLEYWKNE